MPLQNRVTPTSQLCAYSSRGTFMGNRGLLHNDHRQITRHWALERWITCVLEFKGVRRQVMSPGRYTELFFLDEATSYAAGHRPCSYCRRASYKHFQTLWAKVFPEADRSAVGIDRVLHGERLNADGSQRTWRARLGSLPDGTMIEADGQAILLWRGKQWRWSFEGYELFGERLPADEQVVVLTPEHVVQLFRAGLSADLVVHRSATVGA
jgi:hypothetical protein